jgi:hypothetical protein
MADATIVDATMVQHAGTVISKQAIPPVPEGTAVRRRMPR